MFENSLFNPLLLIIVCVVAKNLLFTPATRDLTDGKRAGEGCDGAARGHLNVIHICVKRYPAGFANEPGICDPSYQRWSK